MRVLLISVLVSACAVDGPTTAEQSSALSRTDLAGGAFTCDFGLPADLPLDVIAPQIERDRMYMAAQPGMENKHLPIGFDPSGNLTSGGRYLFDTRSHAASYRDFVEHRYVLDGVQFLSRPYFLLPECHDWSVIGAHDFAPIDHQIVLRTERLAVAAPLPVLRLLLAWPAILVEAARRRYTAVWLLFNEAEGLASVVYYTDRATDDPTNPDFAALGALQSATPLGNLLGHGFTRTFDRTQWILTIWYPFVAGDSGTPSLWPYSPPFAEPSCGDGVCEASRGEDHATCAADCAPQCGDVICDSDENTQTCPGDCRIAF
jgi:hypothetical protein